MQQGWYCPNCYAPNQDFMPACARCGSGKPLAYPMQQMQQQQSINPPPPPPPPPLQRHHQIGGYRDPRQLGYQLQLDNAAAAIAGDDHSMPDFAAALSVQVLIEDMLEHR